AFGLEVRTVTVATQYRHPMRDCPDDGDRDGRYYRHIRDRKRSTDPAFTLPRPGTPGCPLGIDQGHAEIRGGAGQLSRLETAKRDVQLYDCDSAVQGTKLRDDRRGRPRRVRWRSRDVECFRRAWGGLDPGAVVPPGGRTGWSQRCRPPQLRALDSQVRRRGVR